MKKIAMFVNVDWFFLSHRLPIAQASKVNNVDMTVYTDFTRDHSETSETEFKLKQSPIRRTSKSIFHALFEFINTLKLIKTSNPDLIHAVTIKPIIVTGIISRLHNIPFVGAITGLGPAFQPKNYLGKIRLWVVIKLFKFIFRHTQSIVICQTENDRDMLVKSNVISKDNAILVPGSGVDIQKFSPELKDPSLEKYILMSSRILRDKGIEEFCKAAKIVNEALKDKIKFKLSGPIDTHSPSFIKESDLIEITNTYGVEYLGDREDMPELLASALMFVLPSYYAEGIPKVLLEAASSGIAIITTDHPGCRDAIKNMETGILVPPKDEVALADAIIKLLDNPKLMAQMGISARDFAEKKFQESKVIELHYSIYQQLHN